MNTTTKASHTGVYIARNRHGRGFVIQDQQGKVIPDALIVAAPDLLSAVYDLLDIVQSEYANDPEPEDLPSWKRAIEQAEVAIAKAEGEK